MSTTTNDAILYTGKTRTTGGRDGHAQSSDGRLDIRLDPPGSNRAGTNPEQLFAAGWSACFIGAMHIAAGKANVKLPAETAVDAEVDLCNVDGAYFLRSTARTTRNTRVPLPLRLPAPQEHRAPRMCSARREWCR